MATFAQDLIGLGMAAALAEKIGNQVGDADSTFPSGDLTLSRASAGVRKLVVSSLTVSGNFSSNSSTNDVNFGSSSNHVVNFQSNALTRWVLNTSGDLSQDGTNGGNILFNRVGKGLQVKEGSNARMGVATLVGGTVTVANTSITATTRIFLSRTTTGGTTGHLSTTQTASTNFIITSSSGTDTSVIAWFLMEPL